MFTTPQATLLCPTYTTLEVTRPCPTYTARRGTDWIFLSFDKIKKICVFIEQSDNTVRHTACLSDISPSLYLSLSGLQSLGHSGEVISSGLDNLQQSLEVETVQLSILVTYVLWLQGHHGTVRMSN